MQLGISKTGPLSIKDQIKAQLRALIASGQLPGGESLPSARDLAAMVQVNRNTAALAYRELAEEGLVETVRGSGTFVKKGFSGPDTRPLYEICDQALDRAGELGFSAKQICEAFYERLTARSGRIRARVLVTWCNRTSLEEVGRALETELGVETRRVLLQELQADSELARTCFGQADLVVTSVNYLEEVAALDKPADLETVGLLLTSTTHILNEINRLPRGVTVGVTCINDLASRATEKTIRLSGGSTLKTVWAGADDQAALAAMAEQCEVIFATSYVYEQVAALVRPGRKVIKLDIAVNPVHIDLVRERLNRALRKKAGRDLNTHDR